MKRTTMLLLLALTLIAGALSWSVPSAQAASKKCVPPACFASPGCCFDSQCDTFCGGAGLGLCGASQCCTCQG